MKNTILYYYNLNPNTIHRIDDDYRWVINENHYLFHKIDEKIDNLMDISVFNDAIIKSGLPCHQIIRNSSGDILTYVDGKQYILMKIYVKNRDIFTNDLIVFSNYTLDKTKYRFLDRSDWYSMWSAKVDYIEYQVGQLGKNFPLIRQSINYYIGLAETAISLISNLKIDSNYLSLSHKRIKSISKLQDLYNPLSLILDTRVRDVGEYYKEQFFVKSINYEEIVNFISIYQITNVEAVLLIARMLFPSYYFDCYQRIVLNEISEKEITKYILKANEYQRFLKQLYVYLKQHYNLPEIEWLIKT